MTERNPDLQRLNQLLDAENYSTVFILTDSNTRRHCLSMFNEKLNHPKKKIILEIPAGERYKNIESCNLLWNNISELHGDRRSLLINLGGGVITDIGGFVASTFKRGIDFVHVPTTLLAMVDAAIGGKNGVDLGFLKNQIGLINEPLMIINEVAFLKTLPERQLKSGMAEMLKHGIIASEKYFDDVVSSDPLDDNITTLIQESVMIKNRIVTEDPMEYGQRKTLNFGHTLGHAIESFSLSNHKEAPVLHGEAVAIGMILESYISIEYAGLSKTALNKITAGILGHFDRIIFTQEDINAILQLLIYDKKASDGIVYFVLMEAFGKAKINCEVSKDSLLRAFEFYNNF